jgi:hypothetical protein
MSHRAIRFEQTILLLLIVVWVSASAFPWQALAAQPQPSPRASESVQSGAVNAVDGSGTTGAATIPALISAFDSDSESEREAASEALSKLGKLAVPALIAALKSPHFYARAWSVQTLSQIRPLPDDAANALILALNDKSEVVRFEAADALKGNKVDASTAIREQEDTTGNVDLPVVGDDDDLFTLDQSPQNTRSYSKAEIVAPIPPDDNHEFPSVLKSLVPVVPVHHSARDAKFLVTIHSAKDGEDRLAVWKKVADDKYLAIIGPVSAGSDGTFEDPVVSSSKVLVTGRGRDHYKTALFLDLPVVRGRRDDDARFAIDGDQLQPVRSDSREDQPDGTYKIVEEMHYDADNKVWLVNWKMVVDDAEGKLRQN